MFQLSYRDARPIFEQVRDGMRRLVVSGAIGEGEALPLPGELARQMAINPENARRAYEALVNEGYVRRMPDGSIIAAINRDAPEPGRKKMLLKRFDETGAELIFLGCTQEELSARLARAARNTGEGRT